MQTLLALSRHLYYILTVTEAETTTYVHSNVVEPVEILVSTHTLIVNWMGNCGFLLKMSGLLTQTAVRMETARAHRQIPFLRKC